MMMSSRSSPPPVNFLFLDTGWTDDEDVILQCFGRVRETVTLWRVVENTSTLTHAGVHQSLYATSYRYCEVMQSSKQCVHTLPSVQHLHFTFHPGLLHHHLVL